jgi:hypothetical protein
MRRIRMALALAGQPFGHPSWPDVVDATPIRPAAGDRWDGVADNHLILTRLDDIGPAGRSLAPTGGAAAGA